MSCCLSNYLVIIYTEDRSSHQKSAIVVLHYFDSFDSKSPVMLYIFRKAASTAVRKVHTFTGDIWIISDMIRRTANLKNTYKELLPRKRHRVISDSCSSILWEFWPVYVCIFRKAASAALWKMHIFTGDIWIISVIIRRTAILRKISGERFLRKSHRVISDSCSSILWEFWREIIEIQF